MKKIIFIVIAVLCVAVSVWAIHEERCRYCKGRGWNVCNMCDGHGWRECSFCGGNGYIEYRDGTRETCANCHGKKGFKCNYCVDGERECRACEGTGITRYIGR